MIQPVFIASMMSLWSPRMSRGPDTARVTMLNTIGNRSPDCTGSCSNPKRSPFADVALKTRPPAVLAPKQIPAAPCSPSPGTIRIACSPSAFIASSVSAISVEGVMG